MISLKIQTSSRRDTTIIKISKYDKLSVLIEKYSKAKNVKESSFCFKFDGDVVDPSMTAMDLDLEGDECIDVHEI